MKRLDCLGCREGDVVEFHDHTGQTEGRVVVETTQTLNVYIDSSWECNESDQDLKFEVFSMTCRVGCLVCEQPHLRFRWAATI